MARVVADERSARVPLHSDVSLREAALRDLPDDDTEQSSDESELRLAVRFTRRRRATRVLGVLALLGALGGGTVVLEQPKVRREALAFVTLGHPEGAVRLGHRITAFFERARR